MHVRARGSCDPPTVVAMFPFLRPVRFSKRTASPALTAAILAESPLANSVSEREANDQADSNFQHSDSAEAETRTPPERPCRGLKAGSREPSSVGVPPNYFFVFKGLRRGNAWACQKFLFQLGA
jgi:hypothetical protein